MKEILIQFAFVGCVIFVSASVIFGVMCIFSPTLRREVIKDWKGE